MLLTLTILSESYVTIAYLTVVENFLYSCEIEEGMVMKPIMT